MQTCLSPSKVLSTENTSPTYAISHFNLFPTIIDNCIFNMNVKNENVCLS